MIMNLTLKSKENLKIQCLFLRSHYEGQPVTKIIAVYT